jgi:hypothetical protein
MILQMVTGVVFFTMNGLSSPAWDASGRPSMAVIVAKKHVDACF